MVWRALHILVIGALATVGDGYFMRGLPSKQLKRDHYNFWRLSAVSAAIGMIKKSKTREVASLLQNATESHNIVRYLASGERPEGIVNPVDFYRSAMLRFESVSVMPEYNKKCKTGFIMGLPGPEIMGGVLRDAGSRAIIASMDARSGGTTFDEFERLAREQSRVRPSSHAKSSESMILNSLILHSTTSAGPKDGPWSTAHRLARLRRI